MKRRQTSIPRQWLIADERIGEELWPTLRRLPRGSGVLLLYPTMPAAARSKLVKSLRKLARRRGLVVADELAGDAARVHDAIELRRASRTGVPLLFLSPLAPTRSHPDWAPIPPMKAAALVGLSKAPVIALGGMNERRFRRVERLGFHGWAGIDAWIRT